MVFLLGKHVQLITNLQIKMKIDKCVDWYWWGIIGVVLWQNYGVYLLFMVSAIYLWLVLSIFG